jgi:sortase A
VTVEGCPHLGLEERREQAGSAPSPCHRCCVRVPHERIGVSYQAEICLTAAHRQCPRAAHAPLSDEAVIAKARRTRRTRRQRASAKGRRARRPITIAELLILSLGSSTLFASLFFAYAVAYRLRIGPGMEVAPVVALAPPVATATGLPTLVPTFTPKVPSADAFAAAMVPASSPPPPTLLPPSPEPVLLLPTPELRPPALSPPTRLVIAKISVDIPVVPVGPKTVRQNGTVKSVWGDVPNAGAFHQTSAYPGNGGNTVINGHRDIQGSVFRHLDKLEIGDEIVVYVGDMAYPYTVSETVVVPETFATAKQRAENLKYIGATPEERLTLITCTPVGLGTHRLLVIARPPDEIAPQMPEAGSEASP